MITKIEGIGNYYGSLHVKTTEEKFYMKVYCEASNREWREINEELYNMLIELNNHC